MSESYVAQCPQCRTRFRVTRAQLGAAQGAVRCGACLHVFNAARQIADAARTAPQPTKPANPPTTPTQVAKPAVAAPASPPVKRTPEATKPAPSSAPQPPNIDELRNDNLDLGDLNLDEELDRLEKAEQQRSAQFKNLKGAPGASERHFGPAAKPETDDEAWAEALLREEAQGTDAPAEQEPVGPAIASDKAAKPKPPPATAPSQQDAPGVALHDLAEAPLQLDWQKPKKPWGRWLLWSVLILLALAALAAQYARHNFEDLARQDLYRSWFERICPTLGCHLPPRVDIAQIRSSNLVVRSHPTYRGALVVDAILYNRASFAQPFPVLELRFADIAGQPIASRRFKPSEYLNGELAGQKDMPSQTPIHISLEILDPGSKAVNYSLSFHSPE